MKGISEIFDSLFSIVLLAAIVLIFISDKNENVNQLKKDLKQTTKNIDRNLVESVAQIEHLSDKNDYIQHGIDISHYQGDILNNKQMINQLQFVICKATEGLSFVDPDFKSNWNTIKSLNITRGTYHFFIANDDPLAQAQHFHQTVGPITPEDIPPIVDIEALSLRSNVEPKALQSKLHSFLTEIERLYKRKPMIYTNYYFAQKFLLDSELSDYPLWLAEYSQQKQPKIPTTWQKNGFKIWQRSDTYHIKSKKVDLDIAFGSRESLLTSHQATE